jgi:hypothetical protein
LNIYLFELRAQIKSFIIWTIVLLSALFAFMVGIYPVFYQSLDEVLQMLKGFPPEFAAAFGLNIADFFSYNGFFCFVYSYIAIIGAIMATSLALSTFAREKRSKCVDFLLTKPKNRGNIFCAKLLSNLTILVITNIAFIVTVVIMYRSANEDASLVGKFVLAASGLFFAHLIEKPLDASTVAKRLQCDPRGMTILLDALAGLHLIHKDRGRYSLAPSADKLLTAGGSQSILAMAQHQANCLRNWSQLAMVVKTGRPAEKIQTVRGPEGDAASFIGAMDNISGPMAHQVIQGVKPLKFKHLLDVGGASGTWTIAFLRACPNTTATLFDLPHVIPMAEKRLSAAGMAFSGVSPDGRLVEYIELRDHPWFVATQAHPELKSRPNRPHPLFRDFVGAAAGRSMPAPAAEAATSATTTPPTSVKSRR